MKTKTLLLTAMATFGMTIATMAQNVPNYVPTNGLVGWWPFNGDANDESGNGNNGTVNGASLTTDRFANTNSSYIFNNNYIITSFAGFGQNIGRAFSLWAIGTNGSLLAYGGQYDLPCPPNGDAFQIIKTDSLIEINVDCSSWRYLIPNYSSNTWYHFVFSFPNNVNNLSGVQVYCNSNLLNVNSTQGNGAFSTILDLPVNFGRCHRGNNYYNGIIDDIGAWNRALTQQEITDLYNAINCANNTAITPQINSLPTGSTATFAASTSDPNPSYVWQSDFGQGYVTLNNFGNYSGVNSAILNIANVQLSEHNQPIRVITASGNCIDTSNIAIINIADTCIATITDTTFITVTDTLIINTTITSLNPPSNSNTIKVFPNPTNDHITIDYGNFNVMNGYQLKIDNSLGQQVFQTSITQQSDYLNLTAWGGNGLYFVHIIDPQGNTIDIRKIVLQ